ncbi:MAG: magnesium transporter [Nanoarchaeota archaeon]
MKIYHKIIKESLKIVILTSILGSIGGIAAASIHEKLILFLPLLIILPAINDMVGDFGIIMSSRFTTMLFTGKIDKNWSDSIEFAKLYKNIVIIAIIMAVYAAIASNIIGHFYGFDLDLFVMLKITLISIISVSLLVILMLFTSVIGGLMIFKKGEDPDNFLIPVNTALGDFGSLVIFTILIIILF